MFNEEVSNTVLISDMLPQRHPEIHRQLCQILTEHNVLMMVVSGMSDIWIRDAAPVQVDKSKFVQFRYFPDYLRDGYQHLITGDEVFRKLEFVRSRVNSTLIIDGGNIVATNNIAIVTDKIFTENREQSRNEIVVELGELLRVKHVVIVPKEPYDTIGHADGMLRFVGADHVVLNDYRSIDRRFANQIENRLRAANLRFTRIPYRPSAKVVGGIPSAVGNYVNYLRVGNLLMVAAYGFDQDAEAHKMLMKLHPRCRVVPMDCRELADEGGVLNCATWTICRQMTP